MANSGTALALALVPIVQEAGWVPELVWTQRLQEKSFASAGDQTSIARSAILWPDTVLTELPCSRKHKHQTSLNTAYLCIGSLM
jgi:hypothetical protein